jgi:D-aminoacyl-tRNA deacylase
MESFSNGGVRLLKHERGITEEDNLDQRWREATGEHVSEVVFLSKHTAASNRPALTVHPIGPPALLFFICNLILLFFFLTCDLI